MNAIDRTVICDERPQDGPEIRTLLETAFGGVVEADLVEQLRLACRDRISLIALANDRIVGHVLFTPATIDRSAGSVNGYGLAPMAVLPDFQRRGIGTNLVRAGLERLRGLPCPFVIVLGHPEYYPRFGFVPASRVGIRCQWDGVPDDAFMVLTLQPSVSARLAGLAKYRPEFDHTA
jgi:putative acetyltransferase